MAILKCKMCGGDLEINEGMSIAECYYCGTKQTVPKVTDENLTNLFNRANTLRIKSEFDKAEKLYERIIQSNSTLSEAYWGLVLCKYGIEYVDDPATFKKIPTCHRTSYDSIIADEDYKSALQYADDHQRIIYEDQAKEIDRIQKEILALAAKEETYDVFICYKETAADGKRTQDSVIANDIYYQLKQSGFKVFYAAITLEGKLGSAYEPIIFAALNSAKVMLAIGTKPEYFNAVWVKNEWSRFLKIIKADRSKLLIPCYRDMDAYELPDEFAHLQAQDMSKIGFINDVVRGIKRIVGENQNSQNSNPAANEETHSIKSWYIGFIKVPHSNIQTIEAYIKNNQKFEAIRYILDTTNLHRWDAKCWVDHFYSYNLNEMHEIMTPAFREEINLEYNYNNAKDLMNKRKYSEAAKVFSKINGYKDSENLMNDCIEKAKVAEKNTRLKYVKEKTKWESIESCREAINILSAFNGWDDVNEQIDILRRHIIELEELEIKKGQERLEKERWEEIKRLERLKKEKQSKIKAIIVASIIFIIFLFIIIINGLEL